MKYSHTPRPATHQYMIVFDREPESIVTHDREVFTAKDLALRAFAQYVVGGHDPQLWERKVVTLDVDAKLPEPAFPNGKPKLVVRPAGAKPKIALKQVTVFKCKVCGKGFGRRNWRTNHQKACKG